MSKETNETKRFTVALSGPVYELLETIARTESRSVASQAGVMLKAAIDAPMPVILDALKTAQSVLTSEARDSKYDNARRIVKNAITLASK